MTGQHAKVIVASTVALAGIAATVLALIPTRSERTDAPKPRIVTADGSPPAQPQRRQAPAREPVAWAGDADLLPASFVKTRTDAQRTDAMNALGARIDEQQREAGLSDTVTRFLVSAFDDEQSVGEAIASLGGMEHPRAMVLDALLSASLQGASIDTANITVGKPAEEPEPLRGISMNRNRNRGTDGDGNQTDVELVTLSSSFQDHFPAAVGEDARGELVEIVIPMRTAEAPDDDADLRLSLVLRKTPNARVWQPASMQIVTRNTDLMGELLATMRAAADRARMTMQEGAPERGAG